MFKIAVAILISCSAYSQNTDSLFIRSIFTQALSHGESYENLRSLCKDIGARLSGSTEAQMSIEWSKLRMEKCGFSKVYLQEIMVPHWERGTKEVGYIQSKEGTIIKVNILALGGSIGTDGLLEGELILFNTLEDLKKAKASIVKDKIVFINQKMNEAQIQTFKAYGGCYPVRGNGAVEASKLGAKAVIIRSLGMPIDEHPHTGGMHYEDDVAKIPAAAISTKDAELLAQMMQKSTPRFVLEMDCRNFPPAKSYNVIGEITGTEKPNEIITVGGHLDSWDTGEGAHDDGAGVIHSLEALRILKSLNYKPKHTLRVVFFMNEENGNQGGETYATWVKSKNEQQIAAVESDSGGFAPRGFGVDGSAEHLAFLESLEAKFVEYDLHLFQKGHGGVDIGPLKKEYPEIALFGFIPDSQRYFDFHHSPNDVFENVNKRELELGCASIASLLYFIDQQF